MTRQLTQRDREFITALEEVVAEAGESYVYPRSHRTGPYDACNYVHNGAPDCLIGRVLHRVGVSLEVLYSHEGDSASSVMEGLPGYSDRVVWAADEAQGIQDGSGTWGEALEVFRHYLTR